MAIEITALAQIEVNHATDNVNFEAGWLQPTKSKLANQSVIVQNYVSVKICKYASLGGNRNMKWKLAHDISVDGTYNGGLKYEV